MANYVYNTFFIKGTKQSVADLLNLGLKRTKTGNRVSAQMSGEEMVSLLNGMEQRFQFSSFIPRPKTYGVFVNAERQKQSSVSFTTTHRSIASNL